MDKNKKILQVSSADKYQTIDNLFEGLYSQSVYYTLLSLSAIIVASGILLSNTPIIIGGMLVTPLLTPILILALSMSVKSLDPIKKVARRLLISLAIVFGLSFLMALILGITSEVSTLGVTPRNMLLYFLVALASGIAATFAWVHKEISEIMPGVAIAVSLLPPLALMGVWLSAAEWGLVQFYTFVFIVNLVGIVLGSFIIFKLLNFEYTEKKVNKKSKESEK